MRRCTSFGYANRTESGGVPIPLTRTPEKGRGGNVIGTLATTEGIPCSDRISHTGLDRQVPESTIASRPDASVRVNPKTPWEPGLTPVTIDVHAVGVYAGTVERSVPQAPRRANSPRNGRAPSRAQYSTNPGAAPSRPITRTRPRVTR